MDEKYINFQHDERKINFYLPSNQDLIQKRIRRGKHFYELNLLNDVRSRINDGSVFIDCGAHIGNHSIFFGKICKASRVFAFEPFPETYNILLENIAQNGLKNIVHSFSIATGDKNTSGSLGPVDMNNLGLIQLRQNPNGNIKIRRLDDVIPPNQKVDLIKIDVEGMEFETLQGAERIIESFTPLLYIEIQSELQFTKIANFLAQYGYSTQIAFNSTPTFLFQTEKEHNGKGWDYVVNFWRIHN